ncbi:hypothetical protein [Acetobacter sp. DsW_059]|uniref:hypothetical protein n=1 Tax=Acetobacter sp. DsW_059 TaxID=1670661 RepID=UPI000B66D408|nr:hypothetical protein [Acetobacter sp. DsW_059]OUJ10322.1 hypothetical protein HK25_07085 [Acetobacter sp. DsW_059]
MTPFPVEEIRERLADAVEMAGGQRALSRKISIPQPVISKVLSGATETIPESLINALGYIVLPMCVPARKGMNR